MLNAKYQSILYNWLSWLSNQYAIYVSYEMHGNILYEHLNIMIIPNT